MGEVASLYDFESECIRVARQLDAIYEDILEYYGSKIYSMGRLLYELHQKNPEIKVTALCKKVAQFMQYGSEIGVPSLRDYYYNYRFWQKYKEYALKILQITKSFYMVTCGSAPTNHTDCEEDSNDIDEHEAKRLKEEYENYIKPYENHLIFALGKDLPYSFAYLIYKYNVPYREIPRIVTEVKENMMSHREFKKYLSSRYRRRPPPNPVGCEFCLEELEWDKKGVDWIYVAVHIYDLNECRRARLEGRCPIFKTAIDPIEE